MTRMTVELEVPRAELLRRFDARDRANDGAFLAGVVTTGIYCLPSCRARRPRPENVRFFATEADARAAGLRACKRCRPDHFYEHHDPDRERLCALAAAVRAAPYEFADIAALAQRAGVGATKLVALFRRLYHLSPADFLVRARVERAQAVLAGRGASVLEASEASGFESASAFHANFRALTGTTPAAYRELGKEPEFALRLPDGFRAEELLRWFARDPRGTTERVDGARFVKGLELEGEPLAVEVELRAREARVRLRGPRRLPRSTARVAHAHVVRWLGLESDPAAFERRGARSKEIARLVHGRAGLRIPRSGAIFEGLVWAIVGAQVNIAFATVCRAALCELAGTALGGGLFAHPTPAAVARLDHDDLVKRQFSRRKAEYLIDAARAIVAGELDLEGARREPVPLVAERLSAVRGLGPWSVQILCLRSYGFEDCVPIGDVGLAEALKRFFALDERPDPAATARAMEPFAPHRSLASYHLWKTLGP